MKKATTKKPAATTKSGASAAKTGAKSTGAKKSTAPASTKKPADKKDPPPPAATNATKEVEKPKPTIPKIDPIRKSVKGIGEFVKDENRTIRDKPLWPLIIDEKEIAPRFLQYQNVNLIHGFKPENMEPESLRRALLGAIRFGKPLVYDMLDADLNEVFKRRFEDVMPGLYDMLMDKSILKEENYTKLIRESDGEEYQQNKFSDFYMDNFMLIVVTSSPNQHSEFSERTFQVIIE